jgi:hypothetical protein
MKFSAKQDFINKLNVEYGNKNLLELNEIQFVGMKLDNVISWKQFIEAIIGKLNKACYIIRRTKQYLSSDALKMVYYAFFHSIMSYDLIFWGNTTHSRYIFKLQKRGVRIMVGAGNRDSCKRIFGPLKILPLPSQDIYSLVMFVVNNIGLFVINNDRYATETRNSSNLYFP